MFVTALWELQIGNPPFVGSSRNNNIDKNEGLNKNFSILGIPVISKKHNIENSYLCQSKMHAEQKKTTTLVTLIFTFVPCTLIL